MSVDYSLWKELADKAANIKVRPELVKVDDTGLQEEIDDAADVVREQEKKRAELKTDFYFGRPVLGKILILPRSSAAQFRYEKPWACISVASASEELPKINAVQRVGLLQLVFADLDAPASPSFRANYPELADRMFTEEQAKQILQFTKHYWNEIDLLMVHCYAGHSRSPAIGKAISDAYQPEFSKWFDAFYAPNKFVYQVLKEA